MAEIEFSVDLHSSGPATCIIVDYCEQLADMEFSMNSSPDPGGPSTSLIVDYIEQTE